MAGSSASVAPPKRRFFEKVVPKFAPVIRVAFDPGRREKADKASAETCWLFRIFATETGELVWHFNINYEFTTGFLADPWAFRADFPMVYGYDPLGLGMTYVTPVDAAIVTGIDDPAVAWDKLADVFHDHARTEALR